MAIILTLLLWVTGLALRPDYWAGLPNSFAILRNYTEVALLTIGLTSFIACGDIDLSVGAVLALAGSAAAYGLKVAGLDGAQNIFLGRWPRRGPFVDRRRMYAEAREVLQQLKVDVNSVYPKVESLSGGRQQSVAIARAVSFQPKVIVLDEPTANLSVTATGRLLETMAELKAQGVAQIIISHRLIDIFEVGDRVMVLKRGQNVGECLISGSTEQDVLHLMIAGVLTLRAETEDQPAS